MTYLQAFSAAEIFAKSLGKKVETNKGTYYAYITVIDIDIDDKKFDEFEEKLSNIGVKITEVEMNEKNMVIHIIDKKLLMHDEPIDLIDVEKNINDLKSDDVARRISAVADMIEYQKYLKDFIKFHSSAEEKAMFEYDKIKDFVK